MIKGGNTLSRLVTGPCCTTASVLLHRCIDGFPNMFCKRGTHHARTSPTMAGKYH